MRNTISKLLACVLSLALVLSGFGGPVAFVANAAVNDTSISFKVVDQNGAPVSGLQFTLVDPEGEEEEIELDSATNAEGIASYACDGSSEQQIEYVLTLDGGSDYEVTTEVKVGFKWSGSDSYVDTVNGKSFNGETVNVTVKKNTTDDPAPEADPWTVSDFTFDEAGTTVTGLTDSGKAKLMKDSALVIPDTNDGKDIIGIAGTTRAIYDYYGTFAFDGEDGKKYEPTSVKFPAHLEAIGMGAFQTGPGADQKGITSIEFPETLKKIDNMAFRNATFTEVVIPDSVTTIGQGAFAGADANKVKMTSAKLSKNITVVPQSLFATQKISEVEIPEGVTKVDKMAFSGCGVSKLTLPSTLKEIGDQAFENNQLTELEVPASVTKIGKSAFRIFGDKYTASLSKLTLNEGLVSVGKTAFAATLIKEVKLPTTVTTLDKAAFEGCNPKVVVKTIVEDQANQKAPYAKVIKEGTGHTVVYEASAPAKTNVLKVKVVDENGNPVPKIKLYFDDKSDSFTADENGVATFTVGQYVTKGFVGVDTEGYAVAEKNLDVVCSGSPAMIDTVNGEAYDGEQGVVLKVKTVAARKTTATVKFKTVDSEGNPVGNVKLYSNESVYGEYGESNDIGEFATGADGLYDYTLDKYTTGTVRIKVTDKKHSSDQVVVIKCGTKSYSSFADTVDGKEYSEGDVIEIVVKNEAEPEPEPTKPTTLKLKIVDTDGKAVEGVKVVLTAKEYGDVYDPIVLAASDSNGETSFSTLEEEIQPTWVDDYTISIEKNDNYSYESSDVITLEDDRTTNYNFIAKFNDEAYDGTVKTITVKATAQEPVAKNVLKVKTVDESGAAVPNVQLYCDDEVFAFTTGEDGIGTYTLGQYQTGAKEVNVKAGTGYVAVAPILVTGTMNWDTSSAYISKVNGNDYNGEVVELVVKKGEVTPQPVKTSILKVKTVDEQGKAVPNVKLYFDETYNNFITGEDGIGTYTIGQYQSGNVFVGLADSNYSSDAVIKVTCKVSYVTYPVQATIDKVNDVAYDGEPVELVVKSTKPAPAEEFNHASFKVQVVDKEGKPVQGLALELYNQAGHTYYSAGELNFEAVTDENGYATYTCCNCSHELPDEEYEVRLKDSSVYTATNTPVVLIEEGDDWKNCIATIDDVEYTGQVPVIVVEATTHPEIESVSVDKKEVSADGESVTVTVKGKELPAKMYFKKFYGAYDRESNSYHTRTINWDAVEVTAEGTETERTFEVILPAAAEYPTAYAWVLSTSFNKEESFVKTDEIAIKGVEKPELMKINSVETDKKEIAPQGGEVSVTVKGVSLPETAYYRLYSSEGFWLADGSVVLEGDSTTEKTFSIDLPNSATGEDETMSWVIGVCPTRYGNYVKSVAINVVEPAEPTPTPSEPKDYFDEFTVTPGEKVEGATPISYTYSNYVENKETGNWDAIPVESNVNLYTIRVPRSASSVKIDFNGNERIAYGYHNYDNKDGYDSYVNSCAADAIKGYENNGAVGETTATIRKAGESFPEYVFVQSPYVNNISEDLYIIKVETIDDISITDVTRIYGPTRYETSIKVADSMKAALGVDKFDTVILTSGTNYPDALAGSYLSTRLGAPIIVVDDKNLSKISAYVKKNLATDGLVIILGGKSAVSEKVEKAFAGTYETTRIDGATRYETNMNILDAGLEVQGLINTGDENAPKADLSDTVVFVCSGTGYADSLSASSSGCPILIVDPKKGLTDDQIRFLKENKASNFVIAGGVKAVPTSVDSKLAKLGDVERLAGSTRYETSLMLAEMFATDETPNLVLAYGENFPDGLCAGPLAFYTNANLILCTDKNFKDAKTYVEKNKVKGGYVIGGPTLISDKSTMNIFSCDTVKLYK